MLSGIRPEYSGRFRCIGAACEDSCCVGWSVIFDEAACRKYDAIPEGPLRVLIDEHVERLPAHEDGSAPAQFARVRMGSDHVCPFLDEERLCRIQKECGEEFLSITCATYPRIKHRIDGREEMALSLSCPEAARLVLLTPDLLGLNDFARNGAGEGSEARVAEGDSGQDSPGSLIRYFWLIREFVIQLLGNRQYALWQRMFLLGVFTRRMDAQARGELDRGVGVIISEFRAAVQSGTLRTSMETIPADLPLQLDMVLRLAGMKLARSYVGPRFVETVDAFKLGIGYGPGATLESLVRGYGEAYSRWYEPFFAAHSYILENLMVNTVFRTVFPFGKKGLAAEVLPEMEREFALLAIQFALIKGLLIGVAGFHKEAFSSEHVVQTVQSASKHFEHHPDFLEEAQALLIANKLDNARGLTMLVRN